MGGAGIFFNSNSKYHIKFMETVLFFILFVKCEKNSIYTDIEYFLWGGGGGMVAFFIFF